MAYINWMDNNPKWLKVVFCIFYLDLTWMVYRIIKCIKGKYWGSLIIWAVIAIVIGYVWWIVDLIYFLVKDQILEF